MVELLSTKLFIPRPRSNLVSRLRLVERLNAGLDRKLTLIAAPAGFGKTTLLSEWIPQSPRCVIWLSLDEGDNDPTLFWAYIISSLQGLRRDFGAGALAQLQSPQASPITAILTALINDLSAFSEPFAIVLDDYHLIDFQPIHEALTFLIAHQPANMHLILTTRADPPLPLARLRGRDMLNELRANNLRFTAQETAAFLNQVMGLDLSADEVSTLERRTEGWIAGLQIAALSMQSHDDTGAFIQAFSGSHRHILGYLAEEVLDQRSTGTLNFLLQTSILERLCGPLCDEVTGDTGGQATLENLEHANLFITALDNEGIWYRYHRLFAEVLQARLLRTQRERLPELHRRAGNWYARQGMIDEAVRHALAGSDFEDAARLIAGVAGNMVRRGSSVSLIRWLDAIPVEIIQSNPRLCLARAWTFNWGPVVNLESAEEWAQLSLRAASADQSLSSELSGEIAALRATIAATRNEMARCRELSSQALEDLPPDSPWRSVIAFCLGTAHFESGDIAAAAHSFDEALRLSRDDGTHFIQLAAASFLADIHVFQGHLARAMELYQEVLDWADPDLPQKGGVMAYGGQAHILCERNQLDAALAHVQMGVNQVDRVGGAYAAFVLYRVTARVQRSLGNWTDALDAMEQAYQIGQNIQVSLVISQAAALRASLQLAQGDLEAALDWAADSGLGPDDAQASHPGWREVEYLALARVLNAQGRCAEAHLLLDRLLQSAQAEGRDGSAIAILVVQALVNQTQGNGTLAFECLDHALTLAEPEGYVRIFLDEGEPMRLLLDDYQSASRKKRSNGKENPPPRLLAYTEKLLVAFYQPAPVATQAPGASIEALSERELEILHLISMGMTNQEIAHRLVIAVSTVKSHINSLYAKLGTQRRTQAIVIARDLGLLPD
jgi:ATP/maltotriose-dependent transcriptional regulator MalT